MIGVTMQIWQDEDEETSEENGGCCGLSAVEDARRVARSLGIPVLCDEFQEGIQGCCHGLFCGMSIFTGRTPNPCIACNRYVKWEALLSSAAWRSGRITSPQAITPGLTAAKRPVRA